jgi:hypothetical protein
MRYYSVHAPDDEPDSPERFVFIKDGFSWPALFVPILWMLWHRLWLALVYYVVFVLLIAWTGRLANEDIAVVVAILWSLLFALEANSIRRLSLEDRGWDEVGSSFGKDITEAEARFFATGSGKQPETGALDRRAVMVRAVASPAPRLQTTDEPILGLFPEPER